MQNGSDRQMRKKGSGGNMNTRLSRGEHENISNNLNTDMNDLQVRSISQDEDIDSGFGQGYQATPYTVNMEASFDDFNNHVSVCNRDFKENVLKKV